MDHYQQWWASFVWFGLYACILIFLPFHKECSNKPRNVYLGFVAAFALEMFGLPFSLYFVNWMFGIALPEGVLWGHTLITEIGLGGMYVGVLLMIIGLIHIIVGWRIIFKEYWSKEKGVGSLVQSGIYKYIRHPQYTGLILITLGMLAEWTTLPMIIIWPILCFRLFKQARKEETDMLQEFGEEYKKYLMRTGMFFPKYRKKKRDYISTSSRTSEIRDRFPYHPDFVDRGGGML